MKFSISSGYSSKLNFIETIKNISEINNLLEEKLVNNFKLLKVTSSLVTDRINWLNDDFQLSVRPIDFDVPNQKSFGEILLSNNKWRRQLLMKLQELDSELNGITTHFQSVHRDNKIDNNSSIIFEEIGLELFAENKDQNVITNLITKIYENLVEVDTIISAKNVNLNKYHITSNLTFITYSKLRSLYPLLNVGERLNKFGREYGNFVLTSFMHKIINRSDDLKFSQDVFDFDSVVYLYIYNQTIEKVDLIAYAGFQVDREKLKEQNTLIVEDWRKKTIYNNLIKNNEMPLTVSAGVFNSKVSMLILEKEHIAEVQSSIWDKEFINYCKKNNIEIL